MIEGLQASPLEFFGAVEAAVHKRKISQVKLSRVDWKEGGILSAKREYLQVRRKRHLFDICGAPFGNGFFVSWWLGTIESPLTNGIARIPIIGPLVTNTINPMTYYKIDTAMMFQSLVHNAVLEVIDTETETKGVRQLAEFERKPVMRDFLGQ